jgi:signal transduction histidine kinase
VKNPAAGRLLEAAAGGVTHAVGEVRTITDSLRPPAIDDLGLARALAHLAEHAQTPQLAVQTDIESPPAMAPATEVAVYRIASEALANAVRHSRARTVALRLHAEPGLGLVLTVSDDGIGLRRTPASPGSGLGLPSMRQRAEEIGGSLEVTSGSPGASSQRPGTRIRAVLPLTTPETRP